MTTDGNQCQALAQRFAQILLNSLGPVAIKEIDLRNASAPPGTCASHDFCDANMVMEEAFIDIYGHSSLTDDGMDPINVARWNDAWALVTSSGLLALLDMSDRWRIVATPPDGPAIPCCRGTFASSTAARRWIDQEQLCQRFAGFVLSVEPADTTK